MEFDKSKVYTALNADELKPGSKVILADIISDLKRAVENDCVVHLKEILSENYEHRFAEDDAVRPAYALAYLVEEPTSLKWTDLKIGDVIMNKHSQLKYMITGIDETGIEYHTHFSGEWQDDNYLCHFHKVEK